MTQWPWKALASRDASVSLYHLERDPRERVSLEPGSAGEPAGLAARAAALAAGPAPAPREGGAGLSDAERDALRALGYVE